MSLKSKAGAGYYTPWRVSLDKSWEDGFGSPPPRHEHTDSEYMQIVSNFYADREKCRRRADCLIWGSGMEHPVLAMGFVSGKHILMDDQGVLVRVRRANLPERGVSAQALSQRIVDCVNACEGIEDPVTFIKRARAREEKESVSDLRSKSHR